ncbi:MAG TPA: ABC transporter substrate-binding protein [bacterium]|nr:ABC transporter substrate-binding protein [bacterium]
MMTRRQFLATTALTILDASIPGRVVAAPQVQPLRVIVFPGGFNLPLWVAQEKGYLAQRGLAVQLTPTPSSVFQLTHLIDGEFDIAMTAIDNVIAYDEGQGEVLAPGRPDLLAFMGGDSGFLRLIVKPEIQTYADLRGKTLSVDAPSTGYAFVLRKMLEANGLGPKDYSLVPAGGVLERWQALLRGEHAGTLLVTPFEVLAQQRGFRLLGNALDVLRRYQGVVGAARRSWAATHRELLVGFIRAYRDALTWLYSPGNREEGIQILGRNAKFPSDLARKAFEILVDPFTGFAPAAAPDFEGIRTVLELRNQYTSPHKGLGGPLTYVDLRYYLAGEP